MTGGSGLRLNPTQRRFFVLYISFFLCVMLLLAPLYGLTMAELERNVVQTSEEVLAGGLTRLEDEIRLILLAGTTLYKNTRVVSMSYMELPFDAANADRVRQVIANMNDMTSMLEMTDDFGIVFKNGAVLSNGRLHLNKADYFPEYLRDEASADFDAWLMRLTRPDDNHSFTAMRMTTQSGTRDTVVVAMALPYGTAWSQSVVFALVDQARILSLLALPDTLEHAVLTLSDATGQILVDYDAGDVRDAVHITQHSADYGLSVTLSIGRVLFSAKIIGFRNVLFVTFGMLALLGVALSIFFSWRNAKPVIGMLKAAQDAGVAAGGSLGAMNPVSFASGFDYLGAFLGEVGVKLRDNRLLLTAQEQMLRENLFERLLRGEVHSADTFAVARRYLPDFPARCRMVLIRLHGVNALAPDDYSKIQLSLVDTINQTMQAAGGYFHFTSNLLVLLLPAPDLADRDHLEAWLARLSADILEATGIETHIAVGMAFEGMAAIPEAFRRLRQLLRSLDGAPPGRPAFLEDIPRDAQTPAARNALRFYEVLVRGECEMALALLGEDLELLRGNQALTEADVQQFFYLYRHALVQAQDEWEPGQPTPPLPEYRASWSLEEAFGGIAGWAEAFCAARAARHGDAQAQLSRAVIQAIDDNLGNPDLYIRMITEQFQISEAHLQRIVHQATGSSFFKYVDQRRMARARDLLLGTQLPVTQIIAQCGYNSANSFYKAFKRSYGLSPTALRAQGGQPRGDA